MKPTIKTILFLLVLLLLGTNIATIITYSKRLKSEQELTANSDNETISIPDEQVGRFFRDTLNLDSQQQQNFKIYRREYHKNANQILNELSAIRIEMSGALRNNQSNNTELDNLAITLGKKHAQLKKETFNYYFKLQKELNPDQQEMLAVIFENMLNQDQQPRRHNQEKRGTRNGRGRR